SAYREKQVNVTAPSNRATDRETAHSGKISRLQPQPLIVEFSNWLVRNSRWSEAVNSRIAALDHSGRLLFKPSLISSNLARLCRTKAAKVLLTLPAFPRELAIVRHAAQQHERTP